jgi:hypothetical protein
MKKLLIVIGIILLFPYSAFAAGCSWTGNTGTVASPYDHTDVDACVSDAASKTGAVIIQIPAASVSWNAYVTIDMTSWTNVTSLTIQGAGDLPTTCAPAVATSRTMPGGSDVECGSAITGGTTLALTDSGFNITSVAGKKWRISNLSITGTNTTGSSNSFVKPYGTNIGATDGGRIDHIKYRMTGTNFITSEYSTDNTVLIDHIDSLTDQMFTHWSMLTDAKANVSWASDVVQANMNWIENSYISNNNAAPKMLADADGGAAVGIRYNIIDHYYTSGHDFGSVTRAIKWYESYNNKMYWPDLSDNSLDLRGGSGVFYNNYIEVADVENGIVAYCSELSGICMKNYRSMPDVAEGSGWGFFVSAHSCVYSDDTKKMCIGNNWGNNNTAYCTADADCGGVAGSCERIDGPAATTGYPCRDQIGRGKNQTSVPALFWNNTIKKGSASPVYAAAGVNDWAGNSKDIQADRDFCDSSTTMPSSCNSVNTTYVAYTYPHPLTGGGVSTYTLTVSKVGTGTVTSSLALISCGPTCSYDFDVDQTVTLTAQSGAGYWFGGWSGDCTGTSLTSNTLTMSAAKACTTTFRANTVTLGSGGTATIGSGGTITIAP